MTDEIAELKERVARLEARLDGPPGPPVDPAGFWLVERLAGSPESPDGTAGSVAYGGRVRAPGAGEVVWQLEHAVPDVLAADLDAAAGVLAALGHPSRLLLLRRLVHGARTLAELQEALPGTPGQLHHHLRELRSAGLVVSPRRNDYAVPADKVVPILVVLAAVTGRP